jgi:hypothetical protein
MNLTIQFDGSTECRGRNGWFQLHEAYIWTARDSQSGQVEAHLHVASKVQGNMPPIVMNFTNPEELRQLICGLAKALHCMTNPEEDQA